MEVAGEEVEDRMGVEEVCAEEAGGGGEEEIVPDGEAWWVAG